MKGLLGRLSLRTRLIGALAIVLLLTLAVGGPLVLKTGREEGAQTLQEMARREAQRLALILTEPMVLADYPLAEQLARGVARQGGFSRARISFNHSVIEIAAPSTAPDRPEWFAWLLDAPSVTVEERIRVGGREYARIELTLSPNAVEEHLWRLLSRPAAIAAGGALALAVLMSLILRVNLRSLETIAGAARRLLEGRLDARLRLPVHAPPALRATAAALDAAQQRLLAQIDQLAAEKERWQVTLASVGDAVVVTDADGSVRFLNAAAERLTDWDAAEATGRAIEHVLPLLDEEQTHPIDNPARVVLRTEAGQALEGLCRLAPRGGGSVYVYYTAARILNGEGTTCGAVLVLRDDSERRALLAELRRLAFHDPLTGLPNRRALEGRLERALRQVGDAPQRMHAFFYIDLDQFKLVNDTCGHPAGDALLVEIAGVMRGELPAAGEEAPVLGRLGGDEFGLIAFDTDAERALALAGRLIDAIRAHSYRFGERVFQLGASVGIVMLSPGDSIEQILARADAACYLAKRRGRNRALLWRAEDADLRAQSEEMEWIGQMERYFAEGRLQLWRQRITPVRDPGRDGYYEVLLRGVDEQGRLQPPAPMLNAAERYGLAPTLDRWVIRRLAGYLAQHPEDAAAYAVNLSAQSLSDPLFVDFIRTQFGQAGISPARIQFELTETAVVHDIDTARRFIAAIRAEGFRFALDDFGAGMSSFAYLKDLRADVLKIDGAFVRNLDTEPLDYVIVNAIAQIGRDLNIVTVAEFVENAEILEKLQQVGVDYAQGYHIHRPEPFIA